MKKGRHRKFDQDAALKQALSVFWCNGYQAASLSALTEAMGINKPSLYAAFGDKESLYLQALQLYAAQQGAKHFQFLETIDDPRQAIHAFLMSVVQLQTAHDMPAGCFIVNGVTGCGATGRSDKIDYALRAAIHGATTVLMQRFQRDADRRRLPAGAPESLAHYVMTLMMGLGVMAKAGIPLKVLQDTIDCAIIAIPCSVREC